MQDILLPVEARASQGKAVKELRSQGLVPGIIYGQGNQPTSVQVEARVLEKIYHQAGTSRLVEVAVAGEGKHNTLFQDVQMDPLTGRILHFDLYTVRMDEEIETEIPIHVMGEAPAVYNLGGILLRNLESIEIRALPANLPENFTIDISILEELGSAITVGELVKPEGVEILTPAEEVIIKVEEQAEEEPEEELPPEGSEAAMVESEHGSSEGEEVGDAAEEPKEAAKED